MALVEDGRVYEWGEGICGERLCNDEMTQDHQVEDESTSMAGINHNDRESNFSKMIDSLSPLPISLLYEKLRGY